MEQKLNLVDGINYLKRHNISEVLVNVTCRRERDSLKVVAFYGMAIPREQKHEMTFPNSEISYAYFEDGQYISPVFYEMSELYEVVPQLPIEKRVKKTTAIARCNEFYELLLELKRNNIAVSFMGHTAPEETIKWVESTLGKKLPEMKVFNPLDKLSSSTRSVNNSSCLLSLLILFVPAFLYTII